MLTGIVFGIIAAVWLAYLVPWFLNQRSASPSAGVDLDDLHESVQIVTSTDDAEFLTDSGARVSTPAMRNAARYHVRRDAKAAVKRRRIGLHAHLLLLAVGVAVPFIAPISHWWTAVPAVMLVGWIVLCRVSVRTVDSMVARRVAEIDEADEEQTILIEAPSDDEMTERSIEITGPLQQTLESLWEPIPVVPTTYVSRPLPPRSVRTVDLSAPVSSAEAQPPLIAGVDVPESGSDDLPRAVGE